MFDGFNTILVATSAVSVWAPVAVGDVLNNCWKNEENRPFPNQINDGQDTLKKRRATWISNINCAKAIGRQVGVLGLGTAGLRYIAGMNKREEHDVISLGYRPITPNTIDFMSLSQDNDFVTFEVDDIVITAAKKLLGERYEESAFYIPDFDGIVKRQADNNMTATNGTQSELMQVLQLTSSGRTAIHLLRPDPEAATKAKRDGTLLEKYFSTGGSVILECQYGAEEPKKAQLFANKYEEALGESGEGHLTHWQYNAFHAYIDNNSRAKCCYKYYSHDEIPNGWRDWDDVWSSF